MYKYIVIIHYTMNTKLLLALIVYVSCLWGYHYLYFFITEFSGRDTKRSRMHDCIGTWFENVLDYGDQLLCVHQIRNLIMALTFQATMAVVLLGIIFGFAGVAGVIPEFPDIVTAIDLPVWLMVFTLIFSVLNFLLSLRNFTKITFLIRASPDSLARLADDKPYRYLQKLFVNGNRYYTMGQRSILYSMVVLVWFLNVWLFIITVLMVTTVFAFKHDI